MSKATLPEGYIARYEHRRWVVIETFVTIDGVDVDVFSKPLLMSRHEWQRARDEDHGVRVLPKGGRTTCRLHPVVDGQPTILATTTFDVDCGSDDNYVKAIGRNISLGRALKSGVKSRAEKEAMSP